MRMSRWITGVTRTDDIIKESIKMDKCRKVDYGGLAAQNEINIKSETE